MKTIRVNDYDMHYVDIGSGPPLVLVHGSLGDYRVWSPVMGPMSRCHRVIALSLRHFFPEHWDGTGSDFTIPQHVDDLIKFIEALGIGPVDLCGHSRGGHIAFRLAGSRPDLVRRLVLAEPGGTLDPSLAPADPSGTPSPARHYVEAASEKIAAGDIDGGLRTFKDAIDGEGAWTALPAAERQLRRDNAFTLLAQTNEQRKPYSRADAEAIGVPTLFVGGGDTQGQLRVVLEALSKHVPGAGVAMIPDATHVMFVQQPEAFCEAVLGFLDAD
ncbi:MAG: alpha/beta hydrolase [Alphaproteobacteria bacterium]|nr:alpha/beta hydrolase [Alphaproteobacteria bacterium]